MPAGTWYRERGQEAAWENANGQGDSQDWGVEELSHRELDREYVEV